jgi:hypothetical protein
MGSLLGVLGLSCAVLSCLDHNLLSFSIKLAGVSSVPVKLNCATCATVPARTCVHGAVCLSSQTCELQAQKSQMWLILYGPGDRLRPIV